MSEAEVSHHKMMMPKDASVEAIRELYDSYAETFEQELCPESTYPAVHATIRVFLEVLDNADDKNIRIIDLGAGTGLAAIELKKHGFTNIDGLDLSCEMLKKAKEKNAYRNYICEALTEKRLDIPSGTYDVCLSVGAVTSGYIKASAFDEILRLAKAGGYIIFSIRQDAFDHEEFGYAQKFQQLVSNGKWKEVKKIFTDYVVGLPGYEDTKKNEKNKCYVMAYKVLKNE